MLTRRSAVSVLIPLLGLALAACGKSSNGPGVATANRGAGGATAAASASPSPVDREEAQRRFAQCMREHGVDMPDPAPGGPAKLGSSTTIDKKTLASATQACQSLLPNGGELSHLSPEDLERARKFAQCMRDHGIDMPDPDPNAGLGKIIPNGNIDINSQAFKDALQICQALRSGAPSSSGATK